MLYRIVEGIFIKVLKDEAYEYITELINEGKIKYGEIYFINDIAAALAMSRTPVREAIHKLSDENRIDILPSRGFKLHHLTQEEILQLYHFSSAIEGYCAARLAEKYKSQADHSYVAQLQGLVEKMKNSDLENITFKEFYALDNEFHRTLVASLEDSYFINLNDSKRGFPDRPELHLVETSLRKGDILQDHQRILEAICLGDSAGAFLAMLAHADKVFQSY